MIVLHTETNIYSRGAPVSSGCERSAATKEYA